MPSKVKTLADLKQALGRLRQGKKVVFTNGCFDILHFGHVRYLQEAKKLGHILIVGVNSDASTKELKGDRRPIFPQDARAEMLAALECVDFVIIFNEPTPERIIDELKPDVHVKGADYKLQDMPEAELVQSYGGEIVLLPLVEGYSTTDILDRIARAYNDAE